MLLLEVLLVAGLLVAVGLVAAGRGDSLARAWTDRPRHELPPERPLASADVDGVRFGVGFRGYRMDEVDAFVDRMAREVAERDRRIAELTSGGQPTAPGLGTATVQSLGTPPAEPGADDELVSRPTTDR